MKNNKFTKIFLVVLALALCICAVFAMGVSAEDSAETKTPKIISQNLEYSEKFNLMYAVDAATVAAGKVTLNIYNMDPAEVPSALPLATIEAEAPTTDAAVLGNLGVDSAYIFTSTAGVGYGDMVINYYAQATDSAGNKSEVKKYSVAEYFYQRLATAGITADQKALYTSALDFGTRVQKAVLNVTAADELISNLRYVTIEGGTLNGDTQGLYPLGAELAPKKFGAIKATWSVESYASADATPTTKTTTSTFELKDAVKTVIKCTESLDYRAEADNFDTKVKGDDITSMTVNSSVAAADYESADDHGTVVSATIGTTWTSAIKFNLNEKVAKKEDATAIEVSFDIYADFIGDDDNYATWFASFGQATNRLTRIGFYNNKGKISFRNASGWAWKHTTLKFNTDWYHIRTVLYEGDSNVYYYINGEETPIVQALGNTIDVQAVEWYEMFIDTNNSGVLGTNIKLDNVFAGYIKEEPWKETFEEVPALSDMYRKEVETFDKMSVIADVPDSYFTLASTNLTKEFLKEEGKGRVVKLTTSKHGDYLSLKQYGSTVAADQATAFEISFDMRFDTANEFANEPIEIRFMEGSTTLSRTNIYGGTDNPTLYVSAASGSSTGPKSDKTQSPHEWFHIRCVMYKGDQNAYFYINGSTTPICVNNGLAAAATNGGDITKLTEGRILIYSKESPQVNARSEIYIDNYFCGYTMDTNPAAQQ